MRKVNYIWGKIYPMNVIDIVLLCLLIFGFVSGFSKGLFVAVASLVALIAGVYGAIHFSDYVASFFINNVNWDSKFVNIVSFIITFIVIVLIISLIGKALTKIADFAALGILNKLLGGVFGLIKIGFILSVLLIVFEKVNQTIPFVDKEAIDSSVLYHPVKQIAPTIFPNFLKGKGVDLPEIEIKTTV